MRSLYKKDSNIDAFIGILAEPNFNGGMILNFYPTALTGQA